MSKLRERQVWQVAAGDAQHCYLDLFLNHDVVFLGPGSYGPFADGSYRKLIADGLVRKGDFPQIRSMAERMAPGDLVLLRFRYRVEAIGLVTGDYEWNEAFDDVFGWDLQHSRRVIWQDHLRGDLERAQRERDLFWSRKQIPGLTAVKDESVLGPVRHLFERVQERPLRDRPEKPPPCLTPEQLGQELFSRGLPNEAVDKALLALQRQRRMVMWYQQHGRASNRPTEHEVVAHMILPLMLALGWSEQLLAVEWHSIDMACFWGTPTTRDKCVLVCEAKHLGHGLGNVFDQAKNYVSKLDLSNAKKILLTDGQRLYLHGRDAEGSWSPTPVGYVNVERIRTRYIAPAGANAADTIVALTPAGVEREVSSL